MEKYEKLFAFRNEKQKKWNVEFKELQAKKKNCQSNICQKYITVANYLTFLYYNNIL